MNLLFHQNHFQAVKNCNTILCMALFPEFPFYLRSFFGSWWYDSRKSSVWSRGSFQTTVTSEMFETPGKGDWVLILDRREAGYKEPGLDPRINNTTQSCHE
jgi:hypothetical protein